MRREISKKFILFDRNNFVCLFYNVDNHLYLFALSQIRFIIRRGACKYRAKSTRVPERKTFVRVLEFGGGLSGQIDGHRRNQATSMIPTLSCRRHPYVIFFPNSHKHVRGGPQGGRRVEGIRAMVKEAEIGGHRSSRYYLSELSTVRSVMPTYA